MCIRDSYCAVCDGPFYKGKYVLVIGGGNSGFQEGLHLTRWAKHVTIVEFLPEIRASKLFQDAAVGREDMTIVTNHEVKAFRGTRGKLAGVEVKDLSLIHISEPTRLGMISYAVFCLKK